MQIPSHTDIQQAVHCLTLGGVIAYPTEAVYGLGCDPLNTEAIERLLQLKQRSKEKGLILVAADWSQLESWVQPIPPKILAKIQQSWPGPHTWIFPARPEVSEYVRGKHSGIAVRISAHPIVQQLCQAYGSALISTSANVHTQPPARDLSTLKMMLGEQIDFIVAGELGHQRHPTEIRDAMTGEIVRAG